MFVYMLALKIRALRRTTGGCRGVKTGFEIRSVNVVIPGLTRDLGCAVIPSEVDGSKVVPFLTPFPTFRPTPGIPGITSHNIHCTTLASILLIVSRSIKGFSPTSL